MNKTSRLIALLILAASGHALAEDTSVSYNGQRVSLEANKAPINTVKNPEAIAQLPAGHKEKFDFATYRKDSLGFYVKTSSPIKSLTKAEDIAGLRIIVGSGTNQEAILLAWDKGNQAKGLKAFTPVYTKDDAAQTLALQAGRADAYFGPNVIGAWKAALTGKTRLVGSVDGGWPKAAHIAVTVKKGSGLAEPISTALNGVIGNGDYQKVLNRWGEGVEKIDRSEINPAGLGD
ncbi:MAG: transporter substrate-binding protein [Pantoea agglomerans]|nr:transporter substrate-binding protein [Pantoea agglomerans]